MVPKLKIIFDSNQTYKYYLRTHSYWYKILNRNPNMMNNFIEEVKDEYKLRASDRINDFVDKLDMISKFMNAMR